ncbi:MAG: sugar phosphate isomerase/epimerase [Calditrichaeota bacterium]|nr:MAG: sugar phosphate isomerase/epimerase [Calditrichota bacterium]
MDISRRKFIKNAGTMAIVTPFVPLPVRAFNLNRPDEPLKVHIFSKHLQFLDIGEAGQISAELGFEGLDLTVRPKGHVLPENVKFDLPVAIRDIKNSGSTCEMITTVISDVANPLDSDIIKTAAVEGVRYYRSNWFKFKSDRSLEDSLEYYQEKVRQLSDLNKTYNIVGCYQNHSGTYVGASMWEVNKILKAANPEFFGAQYDIRHAVAEGGKSWPNGVKLLKNQIKTIVLKDFKWGKVDGKWQIVNVPVGEGMVDFKSYFKLLKSYGLNPPASLHLEYPLGGAEKGRYEITVDKKIVFFTQKGMP